MRTFTEVIKPTLISLIWLGIRLFICWKIFDYFFREWNIAQVTFSQESIKELLFEIIPFYGAIFFVFSMPTVMTHEFDYVIGSRIVNAGVLVGFIVLTSFITGENPSISVQTGNYILSAVGVIGYIFLIWNIKYIIGDCKGYIKALNRSTEGERAYVEYMKALSNGAYVDVKREYDKFRFADENQTTFTKKQIEEANERMEHQYMEALGNIHDYFKKGMDACVDEDPKTAAYDFRLVLETITIHCLNLYGTADELPDLKDKINYLIDRRFFFNPQEEEELQFVRKIGNKGAHATERPTLDEVRTCSMTIMKIVDRFEKTMH